MTAIFCSACMGFNPSSWPIWSATTISPGLPFIPLGQKEDLEISSAHAIAASNEFTCMNPGLIATISVSFDM